MTENIVIAVVVSMASGLGGSMLTYYMSRKRTRAELKKLELETRKLQADLDYMLRSSAEIMIYDSNKSLPGYDFKDYGGQSYKDGVPFGPKGKAELKFLGEKGRIISICRTNNDGKVHIALEKYTRDGRDPGKVLPANTAIPGMRRLRVSCEVKVTGSPHLLWFGWRFLNGTRAVSDGSERDRVRISVESKSWVPIDKYFDIDPAKQCFLRIDDYYETGKTPSEVQIRRIVIAERRTSD